MLSLLWTGQRSTEHKWMSGLWRVFYSIFTGACHVNTIDRVTVKGPIMYSGLTDVKEGLSSEQPRMYLLP